MCVKGNTHGFCLWWFCLQSKDAKQAGGSLQTIFKSRFAAAIDHLPGIFLGRTFSKSLGPQDNWEERGEPNSHLLSVLLAGKTYSLPQIEKGSPHPVSTGKLKSTQ